MNDVGLPTSWVAMASQTASPLRHAPLHLRQLGLLLHPRRARKLAAALPVGLAYVSPYETDAALDALVLDPMATGRCDAESVLSACRRWPEAPVLVYTELAPGIAPALLALGRAGAQRVLLERVDDAPETIRTAVAALDDGLCRAEGLDLLHATCGVLPDDLRAAIDALLAMPAATHSAERFARLLGVHRRSMERRLARLGLPEPAVLLALARLTVAYALMRRAGGTVHRTSRRLGFTTVRTLQAQARHFAGAPLTVLRDLEPDDLIAVLQQACRARGARLMAVTDRTMNAGQVGAQAGGRMIRKRTAGAPA